MNIQAKLLTCPDSVASMESIVEEWNTMKIETAYLLAQQIERPHVHQSLSRFLGEQWIVIQTLLDTESGMFPLAITDRGIASGTGDGSWLQMLCPRGKNSAGISIRQFRNDQIRYLIRHYNPSGISLDFIRHFVFWEAIYDDSPSESIPRSCFCDTCRDSFASMYQIILPDSREEAIRYLLDNHLAQWEHFAESTITELVKELVEAAQEENPRIRINIHLVPWKNEEFSHALTKRVGQNVSALAPFIDQISPMCYAPMLKRSFKWISELVESLADESMKPVIPALQICAMYGTEELSADAFREMVLAAGKEPSAGIVIWPWERITEIQKIILTQVNL